MRSFFSKLLPTSSPAAKQFKKAIWAITNCRPRNLALYQLAMQHSSVREEAYSNERLEFLGDAVLSLIIGEYLFKKYPLKEEGFLTEIRARIVNRASLGSLAKTIGLDALLHYDKNALHRGGKFIYGNALEALIGAVYLDQGYSPCRKFVLRQLLHCHVDLEELIETDTNYKSQLITWAAKSRKKMLFEIVAEKNQGACREFTARVTVGGKVAGQGKGNSKKQAEQQAAEAALAVCAEVGD